MTALERGVYRPVSGLLNAQIALKLDAILVVSHGRGGRSNSWRCAQTLSSKLRIFDRRID